MKWKDFCLRITIQHHYKVDKMLNKKILIAVIIFLIVISSTLLYSFYIPNNDELLYNTVNSQNRVNMSSNNANDLFIINMELINVPTGNLYIGTSINRNTTAMNNTVENAICNESNNASVTLTYSAILSRSIYYKGSVSYTYRHYDKFLLGEFIVPLSFTEHNITCYNSFPIPVKSNNNYTLSFIINETNCLKNSKNLHNYSYYLKYTLDKIKIVDHTHGYYHDFYYVNGKNHFITPRIKILNIKT